MFTQQFHAKVAAVKGPLFFVRIALPAARCVATTLILYLAIDKNHQFQLFTVMCHNKHHWYANVDHG